MAKIVIWDKKASSELRALERSLAKRIYAAVAQFAISDLGDVKRLQQTKPPQYRLRIGDYRVRFYLVDETMRIIAVKHRREAYR